MVKKLLLAAVVVFASVSLAQTASAYDCYGGGFRGGNSGFGGYGGYSAYRAPIAVQVPVYGIPAYRSGYRGGFNAPYGSLYGPSIYGRGGYGYGRGGGFGSPFNYGRRGGIGIGIGF